MKENKIIIFTSLTIALIAEAFLFYIIYFNQEKIDPILTADLHITLNGCFNFFSALALIGAYRAVKNQQIIKHRNFIFIALIFSAFFLINYIIYHLSAGHTVYQNENLRIIYLIILISHLICSTLSLPLIFITFTLGMLQKKELHRKLAPFTFKLWMYVSVSGVWLVIFLKYLQ